MRRIMITVADDGNGYDVMYSGTSEYSREQVAAILREAAEELLEYGFKDEEESDNA